VGREEMEKVGSKMVKGIVEKNGKRGREWIISKSQGGQSDQSGVSLGRKRERRKVKKIMRNVSYYSLGIFDIWA
jgi:hypothetical protein